MIRRKSESRDERKENTQDQERRTMSDDNTNRDAETSPASAGSRPVAWAVMNGEKPLWVWYDKWDDAPPHAVPLYRHQPVSSSNTFSGAGNHGERGKPTLTDAERQAAGAGADALESLASNATDGRIRGALVIAANTLRGMLDRVK
jgi:hypothetical protein